MQNLLAASRWIDAINVRFGRIANWLVLLACAISAGNAFVRYGINMSSNAWLEIQWYLFGAMVMLGAAYTLKMNEHVRVDVLYSHYGSKLRLWLDLVGGLVFLLPVTIIIAPIMAGTPVVGIGGVLTDRQWRAGIAAGASAMCLVRAAEEMVEKGRLRE